MGGAAAPGMEEESHLRHFPEVEFVKLSESQGVWGEGEMSKVTSRMLTPVDQVGGASPG